MMTKTTLSGATPVYPEARRAQPHPRKPFRVISYSSLDTEFLIGTPRLEIASTTRKTNNMQNFNRDKMRVPRPLRIDGLQWHRHFCLCAFARLSTRRMPNALGSLPLKILIANGLRFLIRVFTRCGKRGGVLQHARRRYNPVLQGRHLCPIQMLYKPVPYCLFTLRYEGPALSLEGRCLTRARWRQGGDSSPP